MGGVAIVGVVGVVVGLASAEPASPPTTGIRSTTSPIKVAPGLGGKAASSGRAAPTTAGAEGQRGDAGAGASAGERGGDATGEGAGASARTGSGGRAVADVEASARTGSGGGAVAVADVEASAGEDAGGSAPQVGEGREARASAAPVTGAPIEAGPEHGGDAEVVTSVDPGELPTRRRRRWGIGSELIGGGVEAGRLYVDGVDASVRTGPIPRLVLPTVEIQGFRRNGHSIDVSVPITNAIVGAVLEGIFLWSTDVFYSLNNGHGRVRQILGPGLGFAVGGARGVRAASVRVPLELGVEVLTERLRWGFKVLARPFFEYAVVSGGGVTVDGPAGGVLAGLGVSRYGVVR